MTHPSLTIGIPACNEEATIDHLLGQVMSQTAPYQRQVIVVSDGSTDRTSEIVSSYPEVRLVVNETRSGKPTALNEVFRLAENEIIVLIDGDVALGDGAIPRVVHAFRQPRMAAASARLVPAVANGSFMNNLGAAKWQAWHECRRRQAKRSDFVYPAGALLAVRREYVRDFTFPLNAVNDDAYLSSVLYRQGFQIGYCPTAEVSAVSPQKIRDLVLQNVRTRVGRRQYRAFPEHLDWERRWRRQLSRLVGKQGHRTSASAYLAVDLLCRMIAAAGASVKLPSGTRLWPAARSTKVRPPTPSPPMANRG